MENQYQSCDSISIHANSIIKQKVVADTQPYVPFIISSSSYDRRRAIIIIPKITSLEKSGEAELVETVSFKMLLLSI